MPVTLPRRRQAEFAGVELVIADPSETCADAETQRAYVHHRELKVDDSPYPMHYFRHVQVVSADVARGAWRVVGGKGERLTCAHRSGKARRHGRSASVNV